MRYALSFQISKADFEPKSNLNAATFQMTLRLFWFLGDAGDAAGGK